MKVQLKITFEEYYQYSFMLLFKVIYNVHVLREPLTFYQKY